MHRHRRAAGQQQRCHRAMQGTAKEHDGLRLLCYLHTYWQPLPAQQQPSRTFRTPLTSESVYAAADGLAPLLLAAGALPLSPARGAPTMEFRTSRRSGSTCA